MNEDMAVLVEMKGYTHRKRSEKLDSFGTLANWSLYITKRWVEEGD